MELARVHLSVRDLQTLHPITVMGLPDVLTMEMKEAIQTLVCLAITPLRMAYQCGKIFI